MKHTSGRQTVSLRDWLARHRTILLTVIIVTVLSMTIYVGIDTWITNNRLSLYGLQPPSAGGAVQTDAARQSQEGSDESTIKANAIDNYIVSSELPRVLSIDKIGVRARVLPMGVNPDGSIQAPKNIFDSGWYTGSVKPGEDGASLIDGHASGATRMGLFAYLDKLATGDTVRLEKGDGDVLVYKVVKVDIVNKDKLNMQDVLKTKKDGESNLNLITCTGTWIDDQKTYDHRVVVYTELVQ